MRLNIVWGKQKSNKWIIRNEYNVSINKYWCVVKDDEKNVIFNQKENKTCIK